MNFFSAPDLGIASQAFTASEKKLTILHCILIVLVTGCIYSPLLSGTPWNGNEPTRVAVAQDMLRTGNWIVPTLHGKLYLLKPPLMNWLIAGSGLLFGAINEWTSRIPSVLALLATALSIYFLTREWLNQHTRFVAAVAVISMTGLVKKGMSAEIDALFIFFVTAILLIWLNGYTKRRQPMLLWGLPLFVVGIAFLTKGPHAAVFFYFTVFAYLLYKRNGSFFLSKAHAASILVLLAVLFVYLAAVLRRISLHEYMNIWIAQISSRGGSSHSHAFLKHLVSFPLEAMLSFMPWIMLAVPAVIDNELRKRAREAFRNELVIFSLVMIIANFPLYWLLPNAYVRYYLPAGPFIAIVLAVLFDLYGSWVTEKPEAKAIFIKTLRIMASVVCLSSALLPAIALSRGLKLSFALVFPVGLIAVTAAALAFRPALISFRNISVVVALWVGLFTLIFTDMNTQKMLMRKESPRQAAQEISRLLPVEANTVYEVGYRRLLGVTSYLNREIVQLDGFSQLKTVSPNGGIFFLFDTDMIENLSAEEKSSFDTMQWEKRYSGTFEKGKNEIVLGRLP